MHVQLLETVTGLPRKPTASRHRSGTISLKLTAGMAETLVVTSGVTAASAEVHNRRVQGTTWVL